MTKKLLLFIIIFSIFPFSCKAKKMDRKNNDSTISEKNNENINIDFIIDNKDYETLKTIINEGYTDNYVYKNEPLLSYFVSNNQTEIAILLLNRVSDLNEIDEQIPLPLFEKIIYNRNTLLEDKFLQKGIDLTYRNSKKGNASYFDLLLSFTEDNIQREMINVFLSFEYVRDYLQKDKGTLFSIIWRWSDSSPLYIETIYGKDYKVSNDVPVLHWSITKLDAIKYFVSKGADTRKVFYGDDYWGSAVDYAYYVKGNLERIQLDGTNIDSSDLKEMDIIIEFLENH